jgi:RNA polymerase sigma-70 factor (ECF subfamily)
LCHEVFLTLPTAVQRAQEIRDPRAWILGVAVRVARNHRRKTNWRNLLLGRFLQDREHFAAGAEVSHESVGDWIDVQAAYERLSPVHKEILALHVHEGLDGEDIAAVLGVPLNTVWTRLRRARLALQAAMQCSQDGRTR